MGLFGKARERGERASVEAAIERGKQIANRRKNLEEAEETWALNLLLSSYVENNGTEAMDEAVKPVSTILAHFNELRPPTRWTVIALLSFVRPYSTTFADSTSPNKSKFELAKPILCLWAWRAFAALPSPTETADAETDRILLHGFANFVKTDPPTFAMEACMEIFDGVFGRFRQHLDQQAFADRYSRFQLLDLGRAAIQLDRLDVFFWILHLRETEVGEHFLRSEDRLQLVVEGLSHGQESTTWWGDRKLVLRVARDFVQIVQEVAVKGEVPSKDTIADIEKGILMLLEGFRIDVPLAPFVLESLAPLLIRRNPPSFSPTFLPFVLKSLVTSRQPSLATSLFHLVPSRTRTLDHFHPLLRSHSPSHSDQMWSKLLAHRNLKPDLVSFESRLVSHSRSSLSEHGETKLLRAWDDLRLMKGMGIERSKKIWDLLMKIYVEVGSERSLKRVKTEFMWRQDDKSLAPDVTSFNILLRRNILTRSREDEESRYSRKGIKQIQLVQSQILHALRVEKHRRNVRGQQSPLDPEPSLTTMTDGVTQNIALAALTRWPEEVKTKDLVRLVKKVLGVDLLGAEGEDEFGEGTGEDEEEEVVVEEAEFRRVRKPAYRIFMRAFQNRGERLMKGRLTERLGREMVAIRRRRTWMEKEARNSM